MVTPVKTDIESIVYDWLVKRNIEFRFQSSLGGGFFELGGAVVDFLVDPDLAWRVMGEYFHRGVTAEGRDVIQKEWLTAQGYRVVDIWGLDIQNNLESTMQLALQGREVLR